MLRVYGVEPVLRERLQSSLKGLLRADWIIISADNQSNHGFGLAKYDAIDEVRRELPRNQWAILFGEMTYEDALADERLAPYFKNPKFRYIHVSDGEISPLAVLVQLFFDFDNNHIDYQKIVEASDRAFKGAHEQVIN